MHAFSLLLASLLLGSVACTAPEEAFDTSSALQDSEASSKQGAFSRFTLAAGELCPVGVDCTSRIELHADGRLLVDMPGDASGRVYEALVEADELSATIQALSDPSLLALLQSKDFVCEEPSDAYESMAWIGLRASFSADVRFCEEASVEAARGLLHALVDSYIPKNEFSSFQILEAGFCSEEDDCVGSIELHADGTLLVDRFGEVGGGIYQAQVSDEDLAQALPRINNLRLRNLLDGPAPKCLAPTKTFESLKLLDGYGKHQVGVTNCDIAEVNLARETLWQLSQRYLPESA